MVRKQSPLQECIYLTEKWKRPIIFQKSAWTLEKVGYLSVPDMLM